MKGVTTIELTDVNTGEKQTYKDENMFTNALQEIYNNNFLRFGVTTDNGFFGSLIRDLSSLESIIGGVYCLDKTLDEDASIVEVPSDCTIVAHASGGYAGSSSTRGTLNTTESAELGNGYKFVWDFATNQGNGTIKCIGLTTSYGGSCGEDFGYADGSIKSPYMTVEDYSNNMSNNGTSGINTQINTAAFDDDLRLYYCQINSSTQITIWKGSRPFPYKSPNLMNYNISSSDNYPFYADKSVTITLPVSIYNNVDRTRFVCDNDGKLYFIGVNSDTTYAYVFELDYDNVEVTTYYTVSTSAIWGYSSSVYSSVNTHMTIHNGYLYYTGSNEATGYIQKIDYTTGNIVQTSPLMEDTSSTFDILGLDYNGHVMIASTTQNYYWDEDSNMIHRMGNLLATPYLIKWVSPYHFIGLYSVANSSSSRVVYRFVANKPLITINNLSTAVTKTSAQTMKITYTVTES